MGLHVPREATAVYGFLAYRTGSGCVGPLLTLGICFAMIFHVGVQASSCDLQTAHTANTTIFERMFSFPFTAVLAPMSRDLHFL